MDTTRYDLSRLDRAELFEFRSLQATMRDENGRPEDLSKLTLDELLRLEDLHYTMAGRVNPHKRTPAHRLDNQREPGLASPELDD